MANLRVKKVLEIEGSGFFAKGRNQKCELSNEERKFLLGLMEKNKIGAVHDFESKLNVSSKVERTLLQIWEEGEYSLSPSLFF